MRIQFAWRTSRERRIAARVTGSVSLILRAWRLRSRRRRAGLQVVRAWRQRVRVRARTLNHALVAAAGKGDLRAVAFLLHPAAGWSLGADPNATGADGETALHAACRVDQLGRNGEPTRTTQTRNGPELATTTVSKDDVRQPNHNGGGRGRCDWVGVVKALVEAGATIEAKDGKGLTPMMTAAAEGGRETVAALAAVGAEVDTAEAGSGRRTPLVIAAQADVSFTHASRTLAPVWPNLQQSACVLFSAWQSRPW